MLAGKELNDAELLHGKEIKSQEGKLAMLREYRKKIEVTRTLIKDAKEETEVTELNHRLQDLLQKYNNIRYKDSRTYSGTTKVAMEKEP